MKTIKNSWIRNSMLVGAASLLLASSEVQARISLVTLPGRDTVQLTIYNSADLTLVRETRILTFRKGINRLEFSWANTLIDPTSVEFQAKTHADAVDVQDVRFPPRVANTLEWRIQSEFAGEVEVQIQYFTSGITWAADYLAETDSQEKLMRLAGSVRVTNNSGEEYENAQVRLIVGVIKLVENIADLARRDEQAEGGVGGGRRAQGSVLLKQKMLTMSAAVPMSMPAPAQAPAEIVKEELSEYFMYTVAGRDTIPNGWSKLLPSFDISEIPIGSYYKYENEQWGDEVMRFYRFKNNTESKLGKEPMPDGEVHAFRIVNADQRYEFTDATHVKYIPIQEQVDLELGADKEVSIRPKLMNWQKTNIQFDNNGEITGWTIKQEWEMEIQNSKAIDITLDIRRHFTGDWTLETQAKFEKMDAEKVKFVLPLKSKEKQTIRYALTTREGTSATR